MVTILIPIFPLIAFPILTFWGYRMKERAHWVTIAALVLSAIFSLAILPEVARGALLSLTFPWLPYGVSTLSLAIRMDPLAALMCVVVTIVATLIQIYSIGYMHGDPRYHRFYAYMALFSAAMLGLVLADNWILLYACWELVGLCSYLLIGFWFEKPEAAKAAKKAFVTTRIGDVGLVLGIFVLFAATGSFSISTILGLASSGALSPTLCGMAAILIFAGAAGKSAQFPLHVWLPDAMEGPTPVSALIHAATMVAAGVYLVARTAPLLAAASGTPAALVIGIIAVITLLMAGAMGMVATDIKRVLAYSTISQLGYMMLGLSAGGVVASMFHLITHAFFKALLFLCAGSVIHAAHTQNLFEMGGLGPRMRITAATMGIGAISLIGIPPFAGFWSKDEILVEVFHRYPVLGVLALLGVLMTSFYMSRLFFLVFWGEKRHHHEAHESPPVMTLPLVILAALSIVVGLLGSPWLGMQIQSFLSSGALHEGAAQAVGSSDFLISVFSVGAGVMGIAMAWAFYGARWLDAAKLAQVLQPVYQLLTGKFYIDELYQKLILVPGRVLTSLLAAFDNLVVDGLVNLSGSVTYAFSVMNRTFDSIVVDGAVNLSADLTTGASRVLRLVQTGLIQNYLLVLFAGAFVLIIAKLFQ